MKHAEDLNALVRSIEHLARSENKRELNQLLWKKEKDDSGINEMYINGLCFLFSNYSAVSRRKLHHVDGMTLGELLKSGSDELRFSIEPDCVYMYTFVTGSFSDAIVAAGEANAVIGLKLVDGRWRLIGFQKLND